MTKEDFIELEDLLNRECFKYDKDCNTCPYHGKECKEYEEEHEYSQYNEICYHCKKWLNGCEGTTNKTWTGCVNSRNRRPAVCRNCPTCTDETGQNERRTEP